MREGRSIAAPIFALVIASVLIAALFNFVITFSGPPPKEPPRGAENIAHLLRTGEQPGDPGPRLQAWRSIAVPVAPQGTRADPAAATLMARKLGVPRPAVIAFTQPDRRQFEDAFLGRFLFAWRAAGEWRVVQNPSPPTFLRWHWVTLAAMLGAIGALAVPAWLLAQTLARPLQQLASAAGGARPGSALVLPTGGSREVRALAHAVGQMHGRLAGHAKGRTAMLAAIAHDLGTPLSRLAFRVEQLPEGARARAAADIEEMRGMIATALRFARDDLASAVNKRVEISSLLNSLVDNMREAGADADASPGPRAIVRGDAGALRRLFQNLLDNAVSYGDTARIVWSVTASELVVEIADTGPGIDPAQADWLFEPFVRGDPSRNRATGGTGLGLAIVRSIAERHGGVATLENGAHGAVARVTLPLAR